MSSTKNQRNSAKINNHNIELENFCRSIDNFIDSKFNNGKNSSYSFFPHHIKIQSKQIWYNTIKDFDNVVKLKENINKKFREAIIEYRDNDTELNVN